MSSKNIYLEDLADYDSKLKEQTNILQRNKDYSVGTIINKGNTFLRCTVAGKTANASIDLSNYIVGDRVVYGTAVFEVMDENGDCLWKYDENGNLVPNDRSNRLPIGKANSVPRNTTLYRYASGDELGNISKTLALGDDVFKFDYIIIEARGIPSSGYSFEKTIMVAPEGDLEWQLRYSEPTVDYFFNVALTLDAGGRQAFATLLDKGSTIANVVINKIVGIEFVPMSTEKLMQNLIASAPTYYERDSLPVPNKTTITISKTWVNVNNTGFVNDEKVLDLTNAVSWDNNTYTTASNRAGKDFYIYALETGEYILSANSTVPTGYTATNSRKIGGFHCLCANVGTISGHTLSGYLVGDILPLSVWDLKHRAISENEGMVWIQEIGLWADIYLCSWNGSNLVSKFNQECVTGTSTKAMHGIMMAEELGLVGKRLPTYDEFIVCAKGTPEGDHISTGAVPTGAGGHVGTFGARIISNYGLEDCVGVLWQWSSTLAEHYGTSGSNTAYWRDNSTDYWLSGYDWKDISVYNPTVDAVKRGSCYGLLRRLLLGGGYDASLTSCGSRMASCYDFGSLLFVSVGGRGFCRMR